MGRERKHRRKLDGTPSHRRRSESVKGKQKKLRESTSSDSVYESYDSSPRPRKRTTKRKIYMSSDDETMNEESIAVCKNDALKDLLNATTSDNSDETQKRRTAKKTRNHGDKKVKKAQIHYRCNLRQSIKDLKDLQFREHHILEIKRTPLWFMFNAIYTSNTEVLMKRCSKHEDDINQIMLCFDDLAERFMIGGELLPLNIRDVQLILGVTGGADPIQLNVRKHIIPNWIKRCFRQEIQSAGGSFLLYKNHILEKLKVKLGSNDYICIQDVARLTYCYLLVAVLLCNKNGTLALNLTSYLDEFNSICQYNWCSVIVEMLKGQVNSSKRLKAGGCVMLLPFWLCEHMTLIEADDEYAFPRFLKWDLNKLSKKLLRVEVSKLDSRYIRKIDLKPTSSEKREFQELLNYWEQSSQKTMEQGTDVDERITEGVRILGKDCSVSKVSKDKLRSPPGTPRSPDDLEHVIDIATRVEPVNVNSVRDLNKESTENVGSISTQKMTEFQTGRSDLHHKFVDYDTDEDGFGVQETSDLNRDTHEVCGVSDALHKVDDSRTCGDEFGVQTEPDSNRESTENVGSISTKEMTEFHSGGSDLLHKLGDCDTGGDGFEVQETPLHKADDSRTCEDELGVLTQPDSNRLIRQKELDSRVSEDELGNQSNKFDGFIDEPSFKLNYSQVVTPKKKLTQQSNGAVGDECEGVDVSKSDDQKQDAILKSLQNQINECQKVIREKDFEITTLKGIQLEMKEKQQSCLKEGIRRALLKDHEIRSKLEADVQRLEKEKSDEKASFNEELKKRDKSISDLTWENEQLIARVKDLTLPSATQIYENPENLARISELVELATTKAAHNELVKVHSDLQEDHAELSEYVGIFTEIDNVAEEMSKERTPCINKKKRSARYFSPSTLTKRVKNRTTNEERKKVELTPQFNTNELGKVHEVLSDDDDPPINEESGGKAHPEFVLDESHWAVRKTTDWIKSLAKEHWEKQGPNYVVWTGAGPLAYVSLGNVVSILHHGRISDRVVDSWGEILLETYAEKKVCEKITIFSSLCWGLISGGVTRNAGNLKNLVDVVLEKLVNHELLVFPILTDKSSRASNVGGDHWTLLQLNLRKLEWTFYNSMLPRRTNGIDRHLIQAMIVVEYVEKKLREIFKKTKPNHRLLYDDIKQPTSHVDCPQQTAESVDCGVVVCFNIENIILSKKIKGGEYTKRCAGNYRAKMASWFTDSFNIVPK